jgi:hypothetical protein
MIFSSLSAADCGLKISLSISSHHYSHLTGILWTARIEPMPKRRKLAARATPKRSNEVATKVMARDATSDVVIIVEAAASRIQGQCK